MIAIDVTNVANMAYSATFGSPSNAAIQPNGGNNSDSSNQKKGMIAGIAAGAAVAVNTIIEINQILFI